MDSLETLPLDIFTKLFNDFLDEHFIGLFMLSCTSHRLHQVAFQYAIYLEIPRKLECHRIASKGYLNILKWARYNDYSWDHRTCAEAARNGHFEVLKWVREQGCGWGIDTPNAAASGGHLEILKWALTQDCPKEELTIRSSAIKHNHLHILNWTKQMKFLSNFDNEASIAAKFGYLDIIKELYPTGSNYNWSIYASAALNNQIEVIKWLIDTDKKLERDIYTAPAESTEHYDICANAALNGHLETLRLLRETGFRWNYQTCKNAIEGDHLEVLLWAKSNGCPWGSETEAKAKAKWPSFF